jgi:hypothetical protein
VSLCGNALKGYFGHVPRALLHSPVEYRRFWPGEIFRSASGYDIDKLMIDCITSYEFAPGKANGKQRLRELGKYLMELGSMPLAEFEEFLRMQIWKTNGLFISRMEDQLRACVRSPSFWANDIERYIDVLRRSVMKGDYRIPLDFDARTQWFQRPGVVAAFGLQIWTAFILVAGHRGSCQNIKV